MDILWDKSAWEDYQFWIDNDRKVFQKINSFIEKCQHTPFAGSGKPEALKQNLSGYRSRRITGEHRLGYRVDDYILHSPMQIPLFMPCRYFGILEFQNLVAKYIPHIFLLLAVWPDFEN